MVAGYDLGLLLRLLAVLLVFLGLCWLLARGLGVRLGQKVLLLGLLAPFVVLTPWLSSSRVLAPTSALAGVIPGGPLVDPTDRHDLLNDTLYQLLPWEVEIRRALAERRLPFWSDALEGGSSPWGNPQAAVLSPFAMAARIFHLQYHLLAALAMKAMVAFLGAFLLARFAGRSKAASLLAAAAFALGGGIFAWGLFPISSVAAWTPWLAAGTIRLFRHPSPRVLAVTAFATAALLLAGHPETALAGGLFTVVCGLGLRRRRAPFAKSFAAAAGAAVLGTLLAAPHLFPFLQQMRESQRAAETMTHTLPPYDAVWNRPSTWFLPGYAKFVLAPTNPHAFGRPYREPFRGPINWADCEPGYTGLLAFAGALIALFSRPGDRRLWPFLGFAVASLLLAANFLPIAFVLYTVPGLQVPAYARFLAAASLGLCVAAAFGIDALRCSPRHRRAAGVGAVLAAVLSLAVTADGWALFLWGALLAGLLLLAWRPRVGAAALGAVLLLDLVPWSQSLLPQGHPALFYPKTELTGRLVALAGDPAEGRAVGAAHLVYSSLLPVYGAADVRPHNPLAPVALLRVLDAAFGFHPTMTNYFAAFGNVDHPMLDFLGVRAVVGSPAIPVPGTLEDVAPGRYAPFALYRNPDPLPRWFLPTGIDVIEREGLRSWIAEMSSPSRVALFRNELGGGAPLPGRGTGEPGEGTGVRALSAVPGRIALELPSSTSEILLATSIPFAQGWRASSSDRDLPLLTVNGGFVGVRVPAGTTRVSLAYRPPGLLAGCGLAAVSIMFLVAMLVRNRA